MKKIIISLSCLISIFVFYSCKSQTLETKGSPEYLEEIKKWDQRRIERLKAPDGWLNLVGRTWLKPGVNKFGSAKDNDVVIESDKVPAYMGEFIFKDSAVIMKVYDGVNIIHNGKPVKEIVMIDDQKKDMTVFEYGTIKWNLIIRGDQYGIRFRDLESPLVKNFKGIDRFPVNEDWKLTAKFEAYNPPKKIFVPNVLGQIEEELSPGAVVFEKDGKQFRIDAIDEGDRLFLIIADETSGEETYGGGRFIYVDKPDSAGNINLDFNKAYNPPCVFTKYATCPLPPEQNYLKLKITAGEKNYGEGH
ncbi:MAG: DUF1684 domain-containing protein [Ignavibacterium album]|uniref:DUF1684 domain-containing protein n=1 Tax=Ignavibacterium album TaxID=591197 RepID=UPI0026F09D63|nr:DUF1684 domain-containing protein [Ignavibacterium album]MCX8105623.1 DUF1684 domain-containing protein [Ignavibacterium album]